MIRRLGRALVLVGAIALVALFLVTCAPRVPARSPAALADAGQGSNHAEADASDHADARGPGSTDVGQDAQDPGSNRRVRSFDEAKRALTRIYEQHRVDLYCGCTFGPDPGRALRVDLDACGYVIARDAVRASRIEWEHAVAASVFGRTFTEWTEGDVRCVDSKGKRYKGRKCAARSPEFARMEGDMHNLFPVVGEVNGLRGDLPMGVLDPPDRTPPHRKPTTDVVRFGACKSTIERGVFFPRAEVRGDIARAALYMDRAYPDRHILADAHRAVFERWSAEDPPDAWERQRDALIAERQGNANPFVRDASAIRTENLGLAPQRPAEVGLRPALNLELAPQRPAEVGLRR